MARGRRRCSVSIVGTDCTAGALGGLCGGVWSDLDSRTGWRCVWALWKAAEELEARERGFARLPWRSAGSTSMLGRRRWRATGCVRRDLGRYKAHRLLRCAFEGKCLETGQTKCNRDLRSVGRCPERRGARGTHRARSLKLSSPRKPLKRGLVRGPPRSFARFWGLAPSTAASTPTLRRFLGGRKLQTPGLRYTTRFATQIRTADAHRSSSALWVLSLGVSGGGGDYDRVCIRFRAIQVSLRMPTWFNAFRYLARSSSPPSHVRFRPTSTSVELATAPTKTSVWTRQRPEPRIKSPRGG